jgi:hypothetical protein
LAFAFATFALSAVGGLSASEVHAARRMFYGAYPGFMAATSATESTPQRLAAIRAQMSLLADYL